MRPTLKEQLEARKKVDAMTEGEINEYFSPIGGFNRWLFFKSEFLWHLIMCNWFCIWCGKSHFFFTGTKCREKYFREKKAGML